MRRDVLAKGEWDENDFSDLGYLSGHVLSKTKSVTPTFFPFLAKEEMLRKQKQCGLDPSKTVKMNHLESNGKPALSFQEFLLHTMY